MIASQVAAEESRGIRRALRRSRLHIYQKFISDLVGPVLMAIGMFIAGNMVLPFLGWLVGAAILYVHGPRQLKYLRARLKRRNECEIAIRNAPVLRYSASVDVTYEVVGADLGRFAWLVQAGGAWLLFDDSEEGWAPIRKGRAPSSHLELTYWVESRSNFLVQACWTGDQSVGDAIIASLPPSQTSLPATLAGKVTFLSDSAIVGFLSTQLEEVTDGIWRVKGNDDRKSSELWDVLEQASEISQR